MSPVLAVKTGTGSLGYLAATDQLLEARYWRYDKTLSNCGTEPNPIYLVGVDLPACIRYKDIDKSGGWILYTRIFCSTAFCLSPAYEWDLVADCPWDDNIDIEEWEGDCAYVNLCVAYTGRFLQARVCSNGYLGCLGCEPGDDDYGPCWPMPMYNWRCSDDHDYVCPGWIEYDGGVLRRDGSGWWQHQVWWGREYGRLSISCAGEVAFSMIGGEGWYYVAFSGSGNNISLDGDSIPVGVSVIPVYCTGKWDSPAYVGDITIETSRC